MSDNFSFNLQTIQLDIQYLNIQSIMDLVEKSNCIYDFCPEDNCGYLYFKNNCDMLFFMDELSDLLTTLSELNNSYFSN